jgi:hypothetical protein
MTYGKLKFVKALLIDKKLTYGQYFEHGLNEANEMQ